MAATIRVPNAVAAVLPGKEILSMSRTLFLIIFLCSILFAQQPSSEGDETRIIGLENIWNQAQMSHDATAMGSMLHPDFVFTDYDGTVMAKAQFLASIRDSSNTLALEVSDDMKLHRFGDTAVVTGATHEKGKLKGMALCRQPPGITSKIGCEEPVANESTVLHLSTCERARQSRDRVGLQCAKNLDCTHKES
jgi:ketosteroid isomerase-like protein